MLPQNGQYPEIAIKKDDINKKAVRVYFNDQSFKTFAITESTSVPELVAMFARKLGVKGTMLRHFCLNIVLNGESIHRLVKADNPFKLAQEYTTRYAGWGTTNQNCFLFALKSESAQRLTWCISSKADSNPKKIERIPTAKAPLFNPKNLFTAKPSPSPSPSSPPLSPRSPSSSSSTTTPPPPAAPAKPAMAAAEIDKAIEFANTKLQRILDEASAREKNGEQAADDAEDALNTFMNDMEDLVSALMHLNTPTSPSRR